MYWNIASAAIPAGLAYYMGSPNEAVIAMAVIGYGAYALSRVKPGDSGVAEDIPKQELMYSVGIGAIGLVAARYAGFASDVPLGGGIGALSISPVAEYFASK